MEYVRTVFAVLFIIAFTTIFIYGTFFYSSPPWWKGELIFQEDFNGGHLNFTQWDYAVVRSGKQRDTKMQYRPPPNAANEKIKVRNGHLEISPGATFDFQEDRLVQEIQVRQKSSEFSQGAFLVRAKFPDGKYLGSTIRLVHTSHCFRGQILIVRKPAHTVDTTTSKKVNEGTKLVFGAHFVLRKKRHGHNNKTSSVKIVKNVAFGTNNFDLRGEFHEYGLRWTGTKLRWYFDNMQYYEMSLDPDYWNTKKAMRRSNWCFQNGLFSVPMKLLVDLDVYPGFNQSAEENGNSYAEKLLIDWVKVYEFP